MPLCYLFCYSPMLFHLWCICMCCSNKVLESLIQVNPTMKQTKQKLFFERVIFNLYPHKCLFIVREYHNPESLYTFSVNHAPIVEFLPSDSAGGSRGTLDWIVIGRIEMTSSRRAKRIQKVFFAALIYLRNYKAEHSQQENLHLLIWLRMPQKSSPATRGMVICFLRRMILCLYIF